MERAPILTEYVEQLLRCYILGDFLQAEEFRNSVMDILILKCELSFKDRVACTGLDSTSNSYIISNTLPGSLLCQMIYDYWSAILGRYSILDDKIPKEFYHEVLNYVIVAHNDRRELKAPWDKDRCVYHSHRGQPDQYSCTTKQ